MENLFDIDFPPLILHGGGKSKIQKKIDKKATKNILAQRKNIKGDFYEENPNFYLCVTHGIPTCSDTKICSR